MQKKGNGSEMQVRIQLGQADIRKKSELELSAALTSVLNMSLALEGTVDNKPMLGGSTEGCVRFP